MAPEVKAVFDSVPLDQEMKVGDFGEVIDTFPSINERWATEAKNKLFEMAKGSLTSFFAPEMVPESALDLAVLTRSFICDCRRPLEWRLALMHQEPHCYSPGSDNGEAGVFKVNTGHRQWKAGHFKFYSPSLERAKGTLQALGHDPKMVTGQALDELDEIYECITCTSYETGRQMFDWRGVVRGDLILILKMS